MSTVKMDFINAKGDRDNLIFTLEEVIRYQIEHDDIGLRTSMLRMARKYNETGAIGVIWVELREGSE